ncbi:MAG: formylglycine-generating enzyme family protein, partial [Henriciella sp.]|uniref:formylglycine-generating enzyme family protein n=1 Tax=Henriciella sp. TaxID=1968823 RepID=UPI003C735308
PIMFELTQSADLTSWDGDTNDPRWKQFVADIGQALEQSDAEPASKQEIAPETAVPAPDATIENTFWSSISASDDPADYEAYLQRYPDGHFATLAQNRLANLKAAPAAAIASEPEPVHAPAAPQKVRESTAASPPPQETLSKKGGVPIVTILGGLIVAGIGAGAFVFMSGNAAVQADGEAAALADAFSDCDLCPQMKQLEAGTFLMGSPDDEPGRTGNESPRHEVTLSPFAIGIDEVTFAEWEACVEDGGCGDYTPPDRGFGKGDQPVIGVSWNDAQSYTRWLSGKTGRAYRIPSEAEWEYAARGGTETPYWWGNTFDPKIAPVNAPVAPSSLQENPFGLRAMLGNAREWVEDCYVNNYVDAPNDGSARQTVDCQRRVLRGGAWGRDADDHRVSNRARLDRTVRDKVFGFRVATSELPEN